LFTLCTYLHYVKLLYSISYFIDKISGGKKKSALRHDDYVHLATSVYAYSFFPYYLVRLMIAK